MSCRPLAALALVIALGPSPGAAEEATIAVAANFTPTARVLAERVEGATGHRFRLVSGSTGKLFAQISSGAPFDAFLAADAARPERLEAEGRIRPGSRFTYALGALVLWCPGRAVCDRSTLGGGDFRHLAIANPDLAPYGAAAMEVLTALGLDERLAPHLLRGENVAQALHYVASSGAELGLVSLAQVRRLGRPSHWPVPAELYTPIEQQAVLLTPNPAARALLDHLAGDGGRRLIEGDGYLLPPPRRTP